MCWVSLRYVYSAHKCEYAFLCVHNVVCILCAVLEVFDVCVRCNVIFMLDQTGFTNAIDLYHISWMW